MSLNLIQIPRKINVLKKAVCISLICYHLAKITNRTGSPADDASVGIHSSSKMLGRVLLRHFTSQVYTRPRRHWTVFPSHHLPPPLLSFTMTEVASSPLRSSTAAQWRSTWTRLVLMLFLYSHFWTWAAQHTLMGENGHCSVGNRPCPEGLGRLTSCSATSTCTSANTSCRQFRGKRPDLTHGYRVFRWHKLTMLFQRIRSPPDCLKHLQQHSSSPAPHAFLSAPPSAHSPASGM